MSTYTVVGSGPAVPWEKKQQCPVSLCVINAACCLSGGELEADYETAADEAGGQPEANQPGCSS